MNYKRNLDIPSLQCLRRILEHTDSQGQCYKETSSQRETGGWGWWYTTYSYHLGDRGKRIAMSSSPDRYTMGNPVSKRRVEGTVIAYNSNSSIWKIEAALNYIPTYQVQDQPELHETLSQKREVYV